MTAPENLTGVYVANVTPFRAGPGYELDSHAYLHHVRWLADRGVDGIVPFGTNGEGISVATDEMIPVLEQVFGAELGIKIVPGVMRSGLQQTLRLIEALNSLPADAVLVLPPHYFKPVSDAGLQTFYELVASASVHPVLAYHIPKYAVPVPVQVIKAAGLVGVKDSGDATAYGQEALAAGLHVFNGSESDLWDRLASGVSGTVSALANVAPDQMVALWRCVRSGDEQGGRRIAQELAALRATTKRYASPGVLKQLAEQAHGVPMGTVRPPLEPVP